MSHRLLITYRALSDLREIRDYIARQSPDNAASFLEKILAKFDLIESTRICIRPLPKMILFRTHFGSM